MQAYKSSIAPIANSLVLASDVADAQPASSEASRMLTVPNPMSSSSRSGGSSSTDSQSDPAALVGTAGDDLEQDSKAVLKAGGQDEILDPGVQDESKLKQTEQDVKTQRKAFAAATLKTFQSKLFGHASPVEVEQLVDQVLRQATSLDSLCQMYEGWTAWI